MDGTASNPGTRPAVARKRRWPGRLLSVVLLCLGLVLLAFASGYPQLQLLQYALRHATGFPVHIEGLALYPRLHMARLQFQSQAPDAPPVLDIHNLTVAYRLFRGAGRRIESVSVERVALRLDAELAARIEALKTNGSAKSTAPLAFVPEKVSLRECELQVQLPSLAARLTGVSVDTTFESLEEFAMEVAGASLDGRVELPISGYATSLDGGFLHLEVSRNGTSAVLEHCRVSLPNLAEFDARVEVQFEEDAANFSAFVLDFRILGDGKKTVLLPKLGIPVTIGSLAVNDAHLFGEYEFQTGRFAPAAAQLAAQATNLSIGLDSSAWNLASLDLTAGGTYPQYTAELTVNEALPLQFTTSFEEDAVAASLALADWPRREMLDLLPAQYRAWFDALPALERVSTQARAELRHSDFEVSATVSPGFRDASPFAGPLRAQAKGLLGESPALEGTLALPLEQGTVAATFAAEQTAPPRLDVTLEQVEPGPLVSLTRWNALPEALARPISGTLSATMNEGGIDIESALETASGPWGTDLLAPLPVAMHAAFRWEPANGSLLGARLSLTAGEALGVESRDWRLTLAPLGFEGAFKGTAAFPALSPWASELGAGAEIRYQAPVSLHDGVLTVALDAESDYLQLGDFSFYEAPFHLTGHARLTLGEGVGTLSDLALTYGESSSLNVGEAALSLSPFHVSGSYEFASQLRLLVDAGLLESVEGSIRGRGNLAWDGRLVVTSDYLFEAPLLVTGGSSVALGGIAAAGNLLVDQSIAAQADLSAARCALAGAPMANITAPLAMKDTVLRLEPVAGEVFGGAFTGVASVDLSGESPVVAVDMRLRNVDLARFSEKMVPPDYGLQGLAQGRIAAKLTPDGLQDATVKLVSSGDFFMNKALLQNILLEYLRDVPGAQSIERISTGVLGEAAWRSFDSASLDLGWAENKLSGTASLRSSNLNLTIDVNVDEGSIRQILTLKQKARLEDIEKIRSEPVQQSNQLMHENE
ncbi:MAG: hypothetical protein ACOX5J_12675 [Candidatus Hydrogenedentales bacterium]|jgi:hypothetical protein